MLHACITGGSSIWTYGLAPPLRQVACCDWHSRTHSRSASVVAGGGVGSVTPHPATTPARMAVAHTSGAERLLERAAILAIDATGLSMTRIARAPTRPVTTRHGEGARGARRPAPTGWPSARGDRTRSRPPAACRPATRCTAQRYRARVSGRGGSRSFACLAFEHADVGSRGLPKELRERHAGGRGRAMPAVALLDRDARGGESIADDSANQHAPWATSAC